MSLFKGCGVAMVTPFTQNGVNYAEAERLIEHIIGGGAAAIFALGTTGEPSTMTESEREEFLTFCVKKVAGRVPVIAGSGCNCTADTVERSKKAEKLGADALLVVTPYYNKCTQGGVLAHYRAVGEAVGIPVMAYNVPTRTRVNIQPETAAKLCDIPNLAAIKEASGDIDQLSDTARLIEGGLDLYVGDDSLTLAGIALGAEGVISVAGNVIPDRMQKLCELCFSGDFAAARKLQFSLAPFMKALFSEVNPIPVKKALEFIGIAAGIPRLPLTEMEAPHAATLKEVMSSLGITESR